MTTNNEIADGFPDPEKQFLCFKCRKWTDFDLIGYEVAKDNSLDLDNINIINSFAKSMTGLNRCKPKYICMDCYRKSKNRKIIFWMILLTLLFLAICSKNI